MLKMKNIKKSYMNGIMLVEVLHGIDLEIKDGEMVAIMGASGSGKSTLLGILGCLDQATSGQFEIDETDICQLNENKLNVLRNKQIGFVFQKFHLFQNKTAVENVMMPLYYNDEITNREARVRAVEILNKVKLSHMLENTPSTMSGGECQRVAIARALVNEPKILLADEPTGNLDSKTSAEIIKMLIEIHEETKNTIVIVTHDPNVAKMCQRVLMVYDGKITNDNYKIN